MSERDGIWIVSSYDRDGEMVEPVGEAYLEIDGERVSGTMGINRLMGAIGEDGLAGPLATTRMAGPPHLMDQENRLLQLLDESDVWTVDEAGMSWVREGLTVVELKRSGTDSGVPSS